MRDKLGLCEIQTVAPPPVILFQNVAEYLNVPMIGVYRTANVSIA